MYVVEVVQYDTEGIYIIYDAAFAEITSSMRMMVDAQLVRN